MPPRAAQPILPLTPNQVMAKRRAAVAGSCKDDPIHNQAMLLCQEVEQWFIKGATDQFRKVEAVDFDGSAPAYLVRAHSLLMTSGWVAHVWLPREAGHAVLIVSPPWITSDTL